MFKHIFKYKWFIVIILVLIIVEPSLNSVLNFLLQDLYNSATVGADRIMILRLLTTGFLLWILKRIVIFSNSVLKNRFICNVKQDVKHKMFVNLMGLNTANIADIASSGEYISMFTNDISLLETRFFNQVISLISGLFSIVILGSSFLALNVKLAITILIFGIITMFVPQAFSKKLNSENLNYSNQISVFTQKVKESMVAYPTIKNYSIEQTIANKFDLVNEKTENAKFNADYTLNLANCAGQLMSWFIQLLAVGVGLMMVVNGEILVGTVIAAQGFASDLASPLQEIIVNINSIKSSKEIVRKIKTLSDPESLNQHVKKSEEQLLPNQTESDQSPCEIVFDHLGLQIGEKIIIKDFSFKFEPEKKYLIIGMNGSGKSSLFRALKKWYSTCTGSITIDGRDVSSMENEEISHSVSYLNENVSLFSCSVRDNISLFRPYNQDNFFQAIKDAQVELDLDRIICDEGRNISSGEQRRIEIARSLLNSSKVLIFDEVVSTLDIETAYEIERMVLELKNKTIIFVSHNFSGKLISMYDEILIMKGGELMAHGSYQELLKSSDYFRQICEIKFGTAPIISDPVVE